VALAIFLTVGTNILGVVLIPLWLRAVLSGAQTGVQKLNISYLDLFLKLLLSFSIPTAIGKILREYVPGVLSFVRAHKTHLSLFSNTILAMLIWQTISSGRDILVNAKFGNVLVVIVSTTLIHFVYLIFNAVCLYGLRIPPPEAVSVLIMASQKSAPVAVSVITFITTDTATQGVLAVPCVIGQLMQIFVGQPLALYLGGRIKRWNAEQAALAGGQEGKGELEGIQVEQAQVVEKEVKCRVEA
jgi:sodium/bile acid cotransporter 7